MSCEICGNVNVVGYIPLPMTTGFEEGSRQKPLCQEHFDAAQRNCYFVVFYGETEAKAVERFDWFVAERHKTLMAKRLLAQAGVTVREVPNMKVGRALEDATIAQLSQSPEAP